jgi:hypothetical protein
VVPEGQVAVSVTSLGKKVGAVEVTTCVVNVICMLDELVDDALATPTPAPMASTTPATTAMNFFLTMNSP